MTHRLLFLLFLCLLSSSIRAQDTLKKDWAKIQATFLDTELPDSVKYKSNELFIRSLKSYLESTDPTHDLPPELTRVSVQKSPDGSFRIYTWALLLQGGAYRHYGLFQLISRKENRVILLTDKSDELKNPDTKICFASNWFGAIYYKIIPKSTGKKHRYVLLGMNANNELSRKKIIEVVSIDSRGEPQFGAPLFVTPKKTFSRIVMEYNAQAVVSLKYDESSGRIIFDHLSPSNLSLSGQFRYYGPDLSYDAFRFSGGRLIYEQDIDARNSGENKGKLVKPPKNGLSDPEKR
jgi:hypothetical protein